MAGDWIKLEHVTPDKPEVVAMAAHLGIDQDAVVGKLVRLWIWADQNSLSGNALTVTESFIDRITYTPGFSVALRKVSWLEVRSGSLSIPNFARHNGQTAKSRAVTNRRVAKHREECNADTVTNVTPPPLQKALPEKRREESVLLEKEPKQQQRQQTRVREEPARAAPLNVDQALAYAEQFKRPNPQGLHFGEEVVHAWFDDRTRVGWVAVKHGAEIPIADWQADLRGFARSWQRNEQKAPKPSQQPTTRQPKRTAYDDEDIVLNIL